MDEPTWTARSGEPGHEPGSFWYLPPWHDWAAVFAIAAVVAAVLGTTMGAGGGEPTAFWTGVSIAWPSSAIAAAGFAKQKGRSPVGFFLLGMAVPFVALVFALIIDVGVEQRASTFARELGQQQPPPAEPSPSRAQELAHLAELHGKGVLSDAEFSDAKRRTIEG